MDLPDGVTVTDVGVSPGWTCEPANGGAHCTVASLAPGASTRLSLGLRAAGTATGDLSFTVAGAPAPAVSTLDVMLPNLRISSQLIAHLGTGPDQDVEHGATGALSFAVTNDGPGTAADVVATLTLPRAVGFVDLAKADLGAWACAVTDDRHVTCTLDRLAAGATAGLDLPAKASAVTTDRAVLTVVAGNRPDVTIRSDTPITATSAGLSERGHWSDGYGVTEIGAPALTCDPSESTCTSALKARRQRAEQQLLHDPAHRLRRRPQGPGRGHHRVRRPVLVRQPGARRPVDRPADGRPAAGARVRRVLRRDRLGDRADPGRLVAQLLPVVRRRHRPGDERRPGPVRGVATALGRTDRVKTYYGGWSLVVVYAAPGTHQDVTVYDGGAWIATGSATTFDFASDGDHTATFGVVAWDGDRGSTGDRLTLDGTALVPVRHDGSLGSADDAFTSTAMGSDWANTLGVDAQPFAQVELPEGLHRLTASTAWTST